MRPPTTAPPSTSKRLTRKKNDVIDYIPEDEGKVDFNDQVDFTPKPNPIFQIDFTRPKTSLTDKTTNTVEILPTVKENDGRPVETNTINLKLPEKLSKLFPDVEEQINEPIKGKLPKTELDDLRNILSKIDSGQLLPQLDFFTCGKSEKFENKTKLIDLSTDSSEFVDFIQTGICEQILQNNKLKIHIESGNIYYDNTHTNESIYRFFAGTGR